VYLGKPPIGLEGEVTEGWVLDPSTGAIGASKVGARAVVEGDVFAMTGTWAMTVE
jgi:hypothetical protein